MATLILTTQELIALSAAVLRAGECGHRPPELESAREKIRAQLDGKIQANAPDRGE